MSQDYAKAVEWFTLAAEQDYPESQYYLGVCYYNGQGVAENRSKGVRLLRKARSGGSEEAKKALVYLSE
ncbi:MAG: sel1 repeat family protein [Bacteroidaceae bacterium]|nr:sel1 repeat family protein [Bacteroidaceae bacterium]